MGGWVDPRFGRGWPSCGSNTGRRTVKCDLGLGAVFTVEYQSGAIKALLATCADIKRINDDPADKRKYKVTAFQTYACRQMRTSASASLHSWPVAVDVNPQNNAMNGGRGDIPTWFADCFKNHGFEWGLDWNDAMHFENPQWYGLWDGTYPEVDDVALTATEKEALAFISANEQRFELLFSYAEGMRAYMNGETGAPTDVPAPKMAKAGYRDGNHHDLAEKGGH